MYSLLLRSWRLWEFLLLSICGLEEFMGVEHARPRQLVARDHRLYTDAVNRAAGWSRSETPIDWHTFSFFVIALGLLAYGGYLTWEDWTKLLRLMAPSPSTDLAIGVIALRVFAPLLTGLSYAVIYLSSRRDAPWFLRAGALCLLGLVTAAIEMLVHFIG